MEKAHQVMATSAWPFSFWGCWGGGWGFATVRRGWNHLRCMLAGAGFLLGLVVVGLSPPALAGVVVIGHESLTSLGNLDKNILGRIYTGRTVQVAGQAVQPVNLAAGDAIRVAFIRETLRQSDDDYVAYWIVRRAIGKGAPPQEVNGSREMIELIRSTPGAIGYLDTSQILSGVKVLLTLP